MNSSKVWNRIMFLVIQEIVAVEGTLDVTVMTYGSMEF